MTGFADVPLFQSPAQVLAPEPEPDEVTIECPTCREAITGNRTSRSSARGQAAWKLGTHNRIRHGIKGKGKTGRPKVGQPTAADHEARPVISTIREVASEIAGKGVPTAEQLGAGLGRGLGLAVMGAASVLVETDKSMRGVPDSERDFLVNYLSLSDEAARSLTHPLGRLLAPTKLNAKYGRQVVDNVDVLGAVAELALLGHHWREYLEVRRRNNQLLAEQIAQQGQPLRAVPDLQPAPSAAYATGQFDPVTDASGLTHSPAPTSGVVITAADVERMQREKAGQ